jgi:hypothetical protein
VVAGVELAALVGTGVVAVAVSGDGPGTNQAQAQEASPGQVWREELLLDFNPLKAALPGFVEALEGWRGRDTARSNLARAGLAGFIATRDALNQRTEFAAAPHALANYRLAADLYVETGRLAAVGATLPSGELQDQARLQVKRLRALADRVFDQATVEMRPYVPDGVIPDLGTAKPAEVPSWAGLALAPGPPLAQKPAAASPRVYQSDRPTQSFEDWAKAVAAAGVPAAGDVDSAVERGNAADLGALADAFTAASDSLYAAADPTGERALATRVQLGLLVQAEAARAAQFADLAGAEQASAYRATAKTLVLLGEQLWDPRLGPRASDFPERLLTRPA